MRRGQIGGNGGRRERGETFSLLLLPPHPPIGSSGTPGRAGNSAPALAPVAALAGKYVAPVIGDDARGARKKAAAALLLQGVATWCGLSRATAARMS